MQISYNQLPDFLDLGTTNLKKKRSFQKFKVQSSICGLRVGIVYARIRPLNQIYKGILLYYPHRWGYFSFDKAISD